MKEVWYRYEQANYAAPLNEFDQPIGLGRTDIRLRTFPVVTHTPKGVWIDTGEYPTTYLIEDEEKPQETRKRFVLATANKRYCCPTKADALESFIARKLRQIVILTRQAERAREAVRVAQRTLAKELTNESSGVQKTL